MDNISKGQEKARGRAQVKLAGEAAGSPAGQPGARGEQIQNHKSQISYNSKR